MLQIARKDENHAISNHSKRYYKNESRCHRECRLPDTFGRGRGGWRDPSGGGAGAPRGVPDAPWLQDGRCEDHEGLSFTGKIRDPHRRSDPWKDGQHGEELLLISCYRASLTLACARGVRSIAFPLISSGAYGYPKDQALRIAVRAIRDFLSHTKVDMEIYLVLYDRASYDTACKLFDGIVSYME